MAEPGRDEVLARYFAAFDEPDPCRRVALLESCLAPGAEIRGPQQVFRGPAGIADKIEAFRRRRPGERLVARGGPEPFADTIAVAAALVAPDGSTRAEGEALYEFSPGGLIARVLPFWLVGPAVDAPWPGDDRFRELERSRTQALVARDISTLESLHAPGYRLVTPPGRVFSRADYLGTIAREPFYAAWEPDAMAVRRGQGLAIVRYPARLAFPSGREIRVRHTDAYEPHGGGWRAFFSVATLLEDVPG